MSGNLKSNLLERLEKGGRKARAFHLQDQISLTIPHQIKVLRDQRKWSQTKLGKESGKPANVISRLEDPAYASFTIKTLVELAEAFDVALLVRFVSYGRYLTEYADMTPRAFFVPSFEDELPYIKSSRATTVPNDLMNEAQQRTAETRVIIVEKEKDVELPIPAKQGDGIRRSAGIPGLLYIADEKEKESPIIPPWAIPGIVLPGMVTTKTLSNIPNHP